MLFFEHWGLIEYNEAWERQKNLHAAVQRGERDSTLVFCQHPTVITIGKNTAGNHIVAPEVLLRQRGISTITINRGGDVTLHNPGQLVGYPIFRLTDFQPDLHWFLRSIEQCIINTLAVFSMNSGRLEGLTGIWIEDQRKICAIGLHCSRWVTMHGFALNINNNLDEFQYIVPCGISDKSVTSFEAEKRRQNGLPVNFEEVESICREQFFSYFS